MTITVCDRCGKHTELTGEQDVQRLMPTIYIKRVGDDDVDLCDNCRNLLVQWINKKGLPNHPNKIDPMTLDPDEQEIYNGGYSDGWEQAMFYKSNGGTRDNY